ncbi:MAG: 2Fe-2S iron-sulfur cluster-binding protein [Dehalococcoidia bacterium]|nr:2Fe-2S iron-sulfur cluster-binding protein [Dehalococcoidia bacterium]
MNQVTLTINGIRITAPEGEKLLWAALDNGIYIPNLCGLKENTEPLAACRLCFVEIQGRNKPVTACTETVTERMVVDTKGEQCLRLAKSGFELLMASHALDCGHCLKNRNCELQRIAHHLRVSLKPRILRKILRDLPVDDSHPAFIYDPNKCVLCGRCIWVCRNHVKSGVFGFAHRGFQRRVTTFGDEPMGRSDCDGCLECVRVCPTGALVERGAVPRLGRTEPVY